MINTREETRRIRKKSKFVVETILIELYAFYPSQLHEQPSTLIFICLKLNTFNTQVGPDGIFEGEYHWPSDLSVQSSC